MRSFEAAVFFPLKRIALVGVAIILGMCDVCMVELLPWGASSFYTHSRGFPTLGLMQFCLVLDAIATLGSVVTQMAYLVETEDVDNPTTHGFAKAVFCLNIIFSAGGALAGLIFLYLKRELLRDSPAPVSAPTPANDHKMKSGEEGEDIEGVDITNIEDGGSGTGPDSGSGSDSDGSGSDSDGSSDKEIESGASPLHLDHATTASADGTGTDTGKRESMSNFEATNPMLLAGADLAALSSAIEEDEERLSRPTINIPKKSLGGGGGRGGPGPPPPPGPPRPPSSRATVGGAAPPPPPPPPGRPSQNINSAEGEFAL